MPTILEVLTGENAVSQFDCHRLLPGTNTTFMSRIGLPEDWEPWDEFTYENLTIACKKELSQRYKGDVLPQYLREDINIYNEETLEHAFTRLALPTINFALAQTQYRPHYGRGSRAYLSGSGKEPDWSLITPNRTYEDGSYVNCFPGDTKLSTKWYPNLFQSNKAEWAKPVGQVSDYAAAYKSRDTFIVTDDGAAFIRITRERIGPGLAQGRSKRAQHQKTVSVATAVSTSSSEYGTSDTGGSSFADDEPLEWSYCPPKIMFIPWEAHGERVLTVPLAFFCMALAAASENNWIDYSYAKFNTWREYNNGTFIHNFTGNVKPKLDRKDTLENPQSWGSAEPAEQAEYKQQTPTAEYASSSRIVPVFETGEASTSMSQVPHPEESQREEAVAESSTSVSKQLEDDEQTITSRRSKRNKRHPAKLRQGFSHLYYTNKHGKEVATTKKEWKHVEDGWELNVHGTVYFTPKFPSK